VSADYNGVISGRDFPSTPIIMTPLLTDPVYPIETAENLHFQTLSIFYTHLTKRATIL
jgi:hypothetical protein